ncbi:Aste57867_21073 [Aphanomyces stellatus]|uniref:Aste57867_21073 protein n=1 Tax=Aphanomyces stellatus TaxID=120398 RepID=A0A485LHU1_9STRA|nr:hypothetical protein As57867_021005 [Aphanomyces stellatus]VFT97747.1 Aste57867_21073 [Aphanomyces stellatus]
MDVLASRELIARVFAYQHGLRFNMHYIFHRMGKAAWEVSPSSYGLVHNDRRLTSMCKIDEMLTSWYELNSGVANVVATTRGETSLAILAAHCAFQGDLPALRLLVQKFEVLCTKANLIDWAACNGHLDVIEFLHISTAGVAKNTPWAMEVAAAHGHLHVLKWLHHYRGQRMSAKVIEAAAVHGHLDILKWISGHKTFRTWWLAARGANSKCTDVHEWLHSPETHELMQYGATNVACETCKFKTMAIMPAFEVERCQSAAVVDAVARKRGMSLKDRARKCKIQ